MDDLQPVFSVSEFNDAVNAHLSLLGEVVVEGEISELKVSQGKWVFGTLKDESSTVSLFGVMFQLHNFRQLETGMQVRVYGSPRIHNRSGKFSIGIRAIEPVGEGALQIAFEKLKRQLEAEGLFELSRKRPLSPFPESIALLTAKGSQAYNDFVKVLRGRLGGMTIHFYPVQVQGIESVPSILAALKSCNSHNYDTVVLARGGGSLEDLIAFNDERVVRAVYASKIPVVSAIGHEGDTSLCDLVADLRASTPSNAAELLVRNREDLVREIESHSRLLNLSLNQLLLRKNRSLERSLGQISSHLQSKISSVRLLISSFFRTFEISQGQVQNTNTRLALTRRRLVGSVIFWHERHSTKLSSLLRLLGTLDYRQVLKRGFSITRAMNGSVITSSGSIPLGSPIVTTLSVGSLVSQVSERRKNDS